MFVDFADAADINQKLTVDSQETLAQLFFQTFQRKIAEVGFAVFGENSDILFLSRQWPGIPRWSTFWIWNPKYAGANHLALRRKSIRKLGKWRGKVH